MDKVFILYVSYDLKGLHKNKVKMVFEDEDLAYKKCNRLNEISNTVTYDVMVKEITR